MSDPPVRTIKLWSGCSQYERRLISLMVNEIGHRRFLALCETAKEEDEIAFEEAQDEHFQIIDRMMRGNYNKYAGGKKPEK